MIHFLKSQYDWDGDAATERPRCMGAIVETGKIEQPGERSHAATGPHDESR
jgi:hypothetical protein